MADMVAPTKNPLDRWDGLIATVIFGSALALYIRTLATTLLLGDSAEYQTLAYTLGLAHPTGYPIYLLLGKLVTLLVPLRDIAYRVNLESAIFAALGLALTYLLGKVLSGWRVAALLAPAALGLTRLFWWHAVIAETYDTAVAALALIFLLALLWRRLQNPWLLFWAGLAGGLSLGIHYTVLMAAPGLLVFLILSTRRGKDWLHAVGGVLAGVAVCLVAFFIMDAANAPSSYLHAVLEPSVSVLDISAEADATPIGRIGYLVTGRQFQGQLFSLAPNRVDINYHVYLKSLPQNFTQPLLWSAVLGLLVLLALRRKSRDGTTELRRFPEALMLALSWALTVIYIIHYDIGDIFQFYIPTYLPLALAAAAGVGIILDALAWVIGKVPRLGGRPAVWISGVVGLVFIVYAIQPAIAMIQDSWRAERITFLDGTDYNEYPYPVRNPLWPHETAAAVIDQVEDNAIIFTDWSLVYPLYYVAHVEQGRTGIAIHETYPAMAAKPFAETAQEYVDQSYGTRPIYFLLIEESRLTREYKFVPIDGSIPLYKLEKK